MIDRLLHAMSGREWVPGFLPGASRVLDVQREALGAATSTSNTASSYRVAADPHAGREVARLGAITSLVYTTLTTKLQAGETRSTHSVRRIALGGPDHGRLVWEHPIAEEAFVEAWTGRVGNVIFTADPTRALRGIDLATGAIVWARDERLVAEAVVLPSGMLRLFVDGDQWLDLDTLDGRVVLEGTYTDAAHREALSKGLPSIQGDEPWIEVGNGLWSAVPPAVAFESPGSEPQTFSTAPWGAPGAMIRSGDTIIVWGERIDRHGALSGALVLFDAYRREPAGLIPLGRVGSSLPPRGLTPRGRHVTVSAVFDVDEGGDVPNVTKVVDVDARRVIAELRRSQLDSVFFDAKGRAAMRVRV